MFTRYVYDYRRLKQLPNYCSHWLFIPIGSFCSVRYRLFFRASKLSIFTDVGLFGLIFLQIRVEKIMICRGVLGFLRICLRAIARCTCTVAMCRTPVRHRCVIDPPKTTWRMKRRPWLFYQRFIVSNRSNFIDQLLSHRLCRVHWEFLILSTFI